MVPRNNTQTKPRLYVETVVLGATQLHFGGLRFRCGSRVPSGSRVLVCELLDAA